MSDPSSSLVDMGNYLITLMQANVATFNCTVDDIYYGDQSSFPRTPSFCMDPGTKQRELNGAPRRTLVTLTNYVIIYHNPVTSMQTVREQDDQMAEALEALIHADAQMGGLVIDSLVTSIESGYLMRGKSMYRASRLTVQATQQDMLPYQAF